MEEKIILVGDIKIRRKAVDVSDRNDCSQTGVMPDEASSHIPMKRKRAEEQSTYFISRAGTIASYEQAPLDEHSKETSSPIFHDYYTDVCSASKTKIDKIVRKVKRGIVVKIRIANAIDSDFIEIDLPQATTYQGFLNLCCRELEILPEQVDRIRKLPNTRMRCDADIERLTPFQELEIVLNEIPQFVNVVSSEIYVTNSPDKNDIESQ